MTHHLPRASSFQEEGQLVPREDIVNDETCIHIVTLYIREERRGCLTRVLADYNKLL